MAVILTQWSGTLDDYENQGTGSGTKSQSFQIASGATCIGFSIKASRGLSYAAGTFQGAIVSGANPSGTVLTSDTYNSSALAVFGTEGTFTDFLFTTPVALSASTTYFLRINSLTGHASDEIRWDRTAGGYANGTMWSGNTQNSGLDKMFKIYGPDAVTVVPDLRISFNS